MSEWLTTTLDQLGRVITGRTPTGAMLESYGGDVLFVTPSDMDGRKKIDTTGRYLTAQGVSSVNSALIPKNAIMVSCIGSDMGKAALAGRICVTNQQINSLVVDKNHCEEFIRPIAKVGLSLLK